MTGSWVLPTDGATAEAAGTELAEVAVYQRPVG